jgi:hypothetical protein
MRSTYAVEGSLPADAMLATQRHFRHWRLRSIFTGYNNYIILHRVNGTC